MRIYVELIECEHDVFVKRIPSELAVQAGVD